MVLELKDCVSLFFTDGLNSPAQVQVEVVEKMCYFVLII